MCHDISPVRAAMVLRFPTIVSEILWWLSVVTDHVLNDTPDLSVVSFLEPLMIGALRRSSSVPTSAPVTVCLFHSSSHYGFS